jgi:hypothetical protein
LEKFESNERSLVSSTQDKTYTNINLTNYSLRSSIISMEKSRKNINKKLINSDKLTIDSNHNLKTPQHNSLINFEALEKENSNTKIDIQKLNKYVKYQQLINKDLEADKIALGKNLNINKGFLIYGKNQNEVKFLKEEDTIFKTIENINKIGERQAYLYKDILFDKFCIPQDNKNPNVMSFKIKKRKLSPKMDKSTVIKNIIINIKDKQNFDLLNVKKNLNQQTKIA